MSIADTRRENVRALVRENGGVTAVAKRLGYRNPSFLSQIVGPKASRNVTENLVRSLETEFKLPAGSLDTPSTGTPPAQQPISTELVADVIRMVGSALEDEGVNAVSPDKFATLVALVFTDAVEHNGPREKHIRDIARLLK